MLVAGPFERGLAAKSIRAELYGYECDEKFEKCFRYLEAHRQNWIICVTCEIVFQPLHPDTDAPVHAKTTMKSWWLLRLEDLSSQPCSDGLLST